MSSQIIPVDPFDFVIFGGTGDLAERKLLPALYQRQMAGQFQEPTRIIGASRSPLSDDAYRDFARTAITSFVKKEEIDNGQLESFLARLSYQQVDARSGEGFDNLKQALGTSEAVRVFYLAVAPSLFGDIAKNLAAHELNRGNVRIVVEKPIGRDLETAKQLNDAIGSVFSEHQIFRIDHYLGKETVQNILVLRFANGLFEPIWNRNHIDHVQITVAETVDVGTRGKFYDATGALRDMVPNHLFQLLSLVAMEPPARFDANSVRSGKAEALDSIRIPSTEEALRNSVRAQYRAGRIGDREVTAYRKSPDVAPGSVTETYVALRLDIDNWRWAGVPFYLRTGKALAKRRTEIAVKFKQAPVSMFRNLKMGELADNLLVIAVQPEEGITLHFNAKRPGPKVDIAPVGMKFEYKDYFEAAPSTGYETLIYDCMTGDAILYQRADGVEAGWRAVEPFLQAWAEAGPKGIETYDAGSEGPYEAATLLARDGRRWRRIADLDG